MRKNIFYLLLLLISFFLSFVFYFAYSWVNPTQPPPSGGGVLQTDSSGFKVVTSTYFISGNVGIGTTAPTKKLNVVGDTLIQSGVLNVGQQQPDGTIRPFYMGHDSAAIRIDRINSPNHGPAIIFVRSNSGAVQASWLFGTFVTTGLSIDDFAISDYGTAVDGTSATNRFVIKRSTGNIGIGTTNPQVKLEVAGPLSLTSGYGNVSNSPNPTFSGSGTSPNAGSLSFGNNSGWKYYIGTNVSGAFIPRVTFVDTGNVGIGTTTPQYTLDVAGSIRATSSITVGMNIETLTSDKTLTPGIDAMYQWLNPNSTFIRISLPTSTAKKGDRFIIKNNASFDSPNILNIRQGPYSTIDYIYSGTIKEYIFNGTNWTAGGLGAGGMEMNDSSSLAIGLAASGYEYGTGVGHLAQGFSYGTAVGHNAKGREYGVAVGNSSDGQFSGVALGYKTKAMRYGVSVGYEAGLNLNPDEERYNVLLGAFAGHKITTGIGNIIIGYQSGYNTTTSPTTGSKNILIGFQAGTPSNSISNFLNIGNLIFATGVNTATGSGISTGNVGIGTTAPNRARLEIAGIVGNTNAIFGADQKGVAIINNWPGVGFNMYWSGGSKSISSGYTGSLWVSPVDGHFEIRLGQTNATGPDQAVTENGVFVILNNGNVGIGTTGPIYKLDIVGDVRTSGCLVYNGGTLGTCVSDIRLKRNIQPFEIDNALVKLMNFQPVKYQLENDNTIYTGLIADEIEKFAPEFVSNDENNYKRIKYGDIQWLTIEAIKEQQKQIERLEEKIKVLEEKLGK